MSERISNAPLDLGALLRETEGVDAGSLVVFAGTVRALEAGRDVSALDYDVHLSMADAAIRRIEDEILSREGVLACRIVHRVGEVAAGDPSVYVVVRSRHRPEGFDAAREGIDRVKSEVPIWKEDVFADGSRAASDRAVPLLPGGGEGPGPTSSPGREDQG